MNFFPSPLEVFSVFLADQVAFSGAAHGAPNDPHKAAVPPVEGLVLKGSNPPSLRHFFFLILRFIRFSRRCMRKMSSFVLSLVYISLSLKDWIPFRFSTKLKAVPFSSPNVLS